MRKVIVIALVLFAATTACSSASTPFPTSTPGTAPVEATSIPLPITVKTTGGTLVISKQGRADGWPLNCNASGGSNDPRRCFVKPDAGQTILVIYYSGVTLTAQDATSLFVTEGNKTAPIKSKLSGDSTEGKFFGFMVTAAEKHIILHWPGTQPIPIS